MSGLCISFEEDLMKLSDGFNTDVCRFKGVALPSGQSSCKREGESASTASITDFLIVWALPMWYWYMSDLILNTFKGCWEKDLLLLSQKWTYNVQEQASTTVFLQWNFVLVKLFLACHIVTHIKWIMNMTLPAENKHYLKIFLMQINRWHNAQVG